MKSLLLTIMLLLSLSSHAEVYEWSEQQGDLLGEIVVTKAKFEDTLLDIARHHGFGYSDIKMANPHTDMWLPGENKEVTLPGKYILPMAKRDGIILNIPEMRLYYFPKIKSGEKQKVITYPLGIGREGWGTPFISTKIIQKIKHPAWHPPESIRKEYEEEGRPLPKRVGPGPENPLGDYALRLGMPEYLIHGTNKPYGVGLRVSHGCIRLYPEDIEELFQMIQLNTPVHIVNQPYKVGLSNGRFYLEAHPFLGEDSERFQENLTSVVKMIVALTKEREYKVDWSLAKEVIRDARGIPVEIGHLEVVQLAAGNETSVDMVSGNKFQLKLETEILETVSP